MRVFTHKVLIVLGLTALFTAGMLILKTAFNVIMLMLAGVLIAVYFRGLSYWLIEKTRLSERAALPVVITGTVVIISVGIGLLGTKVQSQISSLGKSLPHSVEEIKKQASQYELGKRLLDNVEGMTKNSSGQNFLKTAGKFFKTTFGVLGDIYIILFIGIFFTANPSLYKNSIIVLIPPDKREKGNDVMNSIGLTLRDWLIGKIFAMFVVAVLTAIGLSIAGIPMALGLAVIAGLLNFIPNFGPLVAMIPAILVASSQGTTMALIVAGLYVGIQVLESNAITPLVQKRLIEIPPAFIITGQVTMGLLTGGLGLILATPLIAVLMVLVQKLYIDNQKSHAMVIHN